MNIVVLGAGAIGSAYGYQLSSRHDVTLVGTSAHVQAIRDRGLRIEGSIQSGIFPLKAVTSLDAIEPGTLIILAAAIAAVLTESNLDGRVISDMKVEIWRDRSLERSRGDAWGALRHRMSR